MRHHGRNRAQGRLWVQLVMVALVLAACQASQDASTSEPTDDTAPTVGESASAEPTAEEPQDFGEVTMALDFQYYGHHAPFALALENGYFEERGVSMAIEPGQSSGVTITSVQGGQIEFGYASPSVLAASIAEDPTIDVITVATIMQHAPWVAAYIEGRGIDEPADLAGKSWGVNPGAPMEAFYRAYMESRGFELGELAGVESQQLLFAGQLDVLPIPVTIYPLLAENARAADLESNYFPLNEAEELDHANWSLITKRSYAEENPELVRAVIEATLQGWYETFNDTGAAADAYLSQFDPLANRDIVIALVEVSLPLTVAPVSCEHGLGWGDEAVWQQSVEVFQSFLGVDPAPDADDLYTNEYVPDGEFVPPTC